MLKEHNREAYEATKAMLLEHRECCLVAATGIGKSNITTELIQELGINALIIVPRRSIKDNWDSIPDEYDVPPMFSTITYQFFCKHYKELYGFEAYIFDECHHAGAPVWGKAIKEFRENLDTEFVLGLTADPNRYSDLDVKNRNVIDTVFNGHAVYGHDQKSAVEAGILPKASYICAIYDTEGLFKEYSKKAMTEELKGRLNYTRTNCEAIEDIIRRHVPKGVPTKGIVFVDSINNIDIGIRLARRSFPRESVQYIHSGLNPIENMETLRMFKTSKSGFIVAVDMLNEGLHIEGINTIIMLRKTSSPTIYTQQIGRGLAAHGKDVTIFDLVRNDTSIKKVLSRIHEVEEEFEGDTEENGTGKRFIKISDQSIIKDYATDILKILEEIDMYANSIKKPRGSWTKDMDNIIREYYPIMGSKVAELIDGKSELDVRLRASKLKVKYNKTPDKWSIEEENILREYYPIMGGKVCELLEKRDRGQCNRRAQLLGIKYNPIWTEKDEEIMKLYYPSLGTKVVDMLEGKTKSAVQHKAIKMGLVVDRIWTPEEDDIIKKYYPLMGRNTSEKLDRRTPSAVVSRANVLGIEYDNRNIWSIDEDDIIRNFYPTMGGKVCELLNGRTYDSCCSRAKLLMVKRNFNIWTPEEDKILKDNYPIIGNQAFKLLPNRTTGACRRRLTVLGVRYK